jgi:antitoxin component of MazEF toxin-antitoxin module
MELIMPQIRMRDRNQITLPATIATAANLHADDTLDVNFVNGVITLIPITKKAARRSIMDYVGSANGMWGKTGAEIDAHIRNERDSWER